MISSGISMDQSARQLSTSGYRPVRNSGWDLEPAVAVHTGVLQLSAADGTVTGLTMSATRVKLWKEYGLNPRTVVVEPDCIAL